MSRYGGLMNSLFCGKRLLSLVFLFWAFSPSAWGYLVLESKTGENTLVLTSGSQTISQPCGSLSFTLLQLSKQKSDSLLSQCKKSSAQDPGTRPDDAYVVSVQSLYGVPWSSNKADALVTLTNTFIEEEREGVEDDRGAKKQRLTLDKLRKAHSEILGHLEADSPRILSWEDEPVLYSIAWDGLDPIYFDGHRSWLISNRSENLNVACPNGWSSASFDTIVNSPFLGELVRWVNMSAKETPRTVLTWYRWHEKVKVEQLDAFRTRDQQFSLSLNPQIVGWRKTQKHQIMRSGEVGTGGPLPSHGGPTKNTLCTRTYLPSEIKRPAAGEISLQAFADEFSLSPEEVLRRTGPHEGLELALAPYAFWDEPLPKDLVATLRPALRKILGLDLASIRTVVKRLGWTSVQFRGAGYISDQEYAWKKAQVDERGLFHYSAQSAIAQGQLETAIRTYSETFDELRRHDER